MEAQDYRYWCERYRELDARLQGAFFAPLSRGEAPDMPTAMRLSAQLREAGEAKRALEDREG